MPLHLTSCGPTRARPPQPKREPAPVPTTFADTVQSLIRKDGRDLSLRQIAILLFMRDRPTVDCTVRCMADAMNVSKPAVSRGFDRLCNVGLMARRVDQRDRRSVEGVLTAAGRAFLAGVPA